MAVREEIVHQPHDNAIAKVKATVPCCFSSVDGEGTAIPNSASEAYTVSCQVSHQTLPSPCQWKRSFPSESMPRTLPHNGWSSASPCGPCLVRAVEVLCQFFISQLSHDRCDVAVPQHSVTSPVVFVLGLHVYSHHHVDRKEIPHLSGWRHVPLRVGSGETSVDSTSMGWTLLRSIQVGGFGQRLKEVLHKHQVDEVQRRAGDGQQLSRSTGVCERLHGWWGNVFCLLPPWIDKGRLVTRHPCTKIDAILMLALIHSRFSHQ